MSHSYSQIYSITGPWWQVTSIYIVDELETTKLKIQPNHRSLKDLKQ